MGMPLSELGISLPVPTAIGGDPDCGCWRRSTGWVKFSMGDHSTIPGLVRKFLEGSQFSLMLAVLTLAIVVVAIPVNPSPDLSYLHHQKSFDC